MAENSSEYGEKSFFAEQLYMNNETFKSQKDSSNPEKEFNS